LPRALRPTRAGWAFCALTLGLGFAAFNTGNNLMYLVLALMLAFLVLSGVLSESALRGIVVQRRLPREIFAGQPALVTLEIGNVQRRVPAFALVVDDRFQDAGADAAERSGGRVFVLRVGPGGRETRAYRLFAGSRGPARFVALRVSTRFPFGLFTKSLRVEAEQPVLVYPALEPGVAAEALSARDASSHQGVAHAGADAEVGGLRDFVPGDTLRRIQWKASARRGALVVRELEAERHGEVEVRLRTRGAAPGEPFERQVRRAAARVVALLERGVPVALRTDSSRLPSGVGRVHRARLLSFLSRLQPDPDAVERVA
jgi:uncharacterized protein (DUF58 family)